MNSLSISPKPEHLDALQELINIGVGQTAAILNQMMSAAVRLQIPVIQVLSPSVAEEVLRQQFGADPIAAVQMGFTGSFTGSAQLVFPTESAVKLIATLIQEELDVLDLDAVKMGALSEVGNIVINGVLAALSNLLRQRLLYSLPTYTEDTVENLLATSTWNDGMTLLLAQARFTIEQHLVTGDLILVFSMASFDALLAALEMEGWG